MAAPKKVAILGGGVASIVAAYELTSTEELREQYDVTVYQLGWRLGGKCASGRNADHHMRIEEHGLHIWFGFYENAFRVMRGAYEELQRKPGEPLATWDQAFKPCDEIVLYDTYKDRWKGFSFKPPRNTMTPGSENYLPTIWEVAHATLDYLLNRWMRLRIEHPAIPNPGEAFPVRWPLGIKPPFGRLIPDELEHVAADVLARVIPRELASPDQAIIGALKMVEEKATLGLLDETRPSEWRFLFDAIELFKRWLWHHVIKPNVDDDEIRLFFTMFDTGTTILAGIVEDRLVEDGFDKINDQDLREWLRKHGANELTIESGPFVRALYDMAFAYKDGNVNTPDMAAGTAVHDLLRIFFTYRGSFAWKMQAGMGDTVFTPFYEVLRKRGVQFEFFNWVTNLGLTEDKAAVDTIDVIQQVALKSGTYDPLVKDVNGLLCWPSEPNWDQIVGGDDLKKQKVNLEWDPHGTTTKRLKRGTDFDKVVLGISVAALPDICKELIEDDNNPDFARMVKNSHTVMTQAFQLWTHKTARDIDWPFGQDSIMTGYVEPLDTYADMSQLLPCESWPAGANVEAVAYFCGVIEDKRGDTQQSANERVRQNALDYLKNDAKRIWPKAVNRDGFDWDVLAGSESRGPARLDSQFWLANHQPTERYVLTPAGSIQHRLKSDQSGYENLVLAGDWVKTGIDAGCVEAATMGGMQASRAICGSPEFILGEDQGWLGAPPTTRLPKGPGGTLPAYVDYFGLGTAPSPVDCEDATLYGFVLRGDRQKLQAMCDQVFTVPTAGAFRPFVPLDRVILTFGVVEKIKPKLFPWCEMGHARECQVAFWIPVLAIHGGVITPGFFVPIMWVDNPLSLAGGREIYGYNKNWGQIGVPKAGAQPLTLTSYGGDFGTGKKAGDFPLMDVHPSLATPFGRTDDDPVWEDLESFLGVAERELFQSPLDPLVTNNATMPVSPLADVLLRRSLPTFFLKQFRSVGDGKLASQQQVTDGGSTITDSFKWARLPGPFDLKLHTLNSHDIGGALGIADQSTDIAFEVRMDFVLEDGRVLWESAAG